MTDPEPTPTGDGQLLEEAAAWFARMRGPDAEDSRADFEAWLARGALHRSAYNRAAEIFAMGKLLGDDEGAGRKHADHVLPRRDLQLRRLALASFAALLLVVGAWALLRPAGHDGLQTASSAPLPMRDGILIATAIGEDRSVRLDDGSNVRLRPDSRLAIQFDRKWRRLLLYKGAARFEVAHEARPFVVQAGGGSVTARGTIFEVAVARDRRVSVNLIRGIVDVRLPKTRAAGGDAPIRRLRAGESLSFAFAGDMHQASEASGNPGSTSVVHAATVDAARDFDNVRLADLIDEANRANARQIILATPTLGERRVSGRFRIDDPELLAQRLAALFDLELEPGSSRILLH